jgi:NitT/TauT family transport system substrate-binding protein
MRGSRQGVTEVVAAVMLTGALLAPASFWKVEPACAQAPADTILVAVSAGRTLDRQVDALGDAAGIFARHGVALRRADADVLSAVAAGAADVGVAVDTLAALEAIMRGAPLRVIAAAMTGADAFWYVAARSPIRSLKDAGGRKVAHAGSGTATSLMLPGLEGLFHVKFRPAAISDPAATLAEVAGLQAASAQGTSSQGTSAQATSAQARSAQVDVGYALPPLGAAALAEGRIRIVARGDDLPLLAERTTRVIVVNASALAQRDGVIRRYLAARGAAVDWLTSDAPSALAAYGRWAGVAESAVPAVRAMLTRAGSLRGDRIRGLDALVADAIAVQRLPAAPGAAAMAAMQALGP